MNKKRWLVFDCNYMCHRSFYSTGHLSYNEVLTGTIFGFLRDAMALKREHGCQNIVFCFDSKTSLRKEAYPEYKANRKELDPEKIKLKIELWDQIKMLRTAYLPYVGFSNVLCAKGYEADDLIASVVLEIPRTEKAIIVSGDHDLYQLFRSNVSMYCPKHKRVFTKKWFVNKWGMHPSRWAEVKALAGCSSDNVKGIKGVGETTAAKWVRGEVSTTSAMYDKILDGINVLETNLPLVQLPFRNTPTFELADDDFKQKKWDKLVSKLGMNSLSSGTEKKQKTSRRPIKSRRHIERDD